MTDTAIDLNRPLRRPGLWRAPRPSWAMFAAAVALAGLTGGLVASAAVQASTPAPAPVPGVAPVILQAPATGHAECQVVVDDGRVSWSYCRHGAAASS